MKVNDLTHLIHPQMPLYPETEPPVLRRNANCEKEGYCHVYLTIGGHTGTHIDAPMHMLAGAPGLDDFPVDKYCGRAIRIDCTDIGIQKFITEDMLLPYEKTISAVDFVLLHTGWDRLWGDAAYFSIFPIPDDCAAGYLAGFRLKGIGIDSSSADLIDSRDYPIHTILFQKEMVIIENLTHLDSLPNGIFQFYCLPIPYQHADGSPITAVAVIENK